MTTKPEIESRTLVRKVETRSADDRMTVAGYAAVFGDTADIGAYFKEVIAPGAFTKTIQNNDIRAYYSHDRGRVLGRQSAGTLRLREDERGLAVEIDLPDTSDGRDVRTLIERGDVSGMSFSFRAIREEWNEATRPPTRTLYEVEVYEVSVVAEPAYGGTSVALRSLDDARREARRAHNAAAFARRKAEAEARFRNIT